MNILAYPYIGRLRSMIYGARGGVILRPVRLSYKYVDFGKDVFLHKHARMEAITAYAGRNYNPQIIIGDHVSVQQNLHMTCADRIEIGNNTAIAANVTITDIDHIYEDINLSVDQQPLAVNPVFIGEDCKIYNNAVILPGTTLGKHCVVGANSVVSGTFGDYCVIVGIPARVIKKYSNETQKWEKI